MRIPRSAQGGGPAPQRQVCIDRERHTRKCRDTHTCYSHTRTCPATAGMQKHTYTHTHIRTCPATAGMQKHTYTHTHTDLPCKNNGRLPRPVFADCLCVIYVYVCMYIHTCIHICRYRYVCTVSATPHTHRRPANKPHIYVRKYKP